ncbi:hypothetical protein QYM36_013280 [Artemia franciscana]|uniref:Endonuclease/exonuclease/phosphatase domain-containing protein n=1 Tax=Artemia franciscana TaxID=6661 RepID=A0AA88HM33_ARTSF|nr:hypothetical protein QYM36_013280 [Artemia franciscana]
MDGSGLVRVGIILIPKVPSGLMDYEAVSERILMVRLKGQSDNLTILSLYAPIRDAPDHLKDKFSADLQLTLNKIPRKDILVIGCDFNARIGTRLKSSEWAIRNHGFGDQCISRVRLLMLSILNNLNLNHADDVDILDESVTEAQLMLDEIAARSLATGLKISQSKTKSMRTSGPDETPITLNCVPIEEVQDFKYLGSLINPKSEVLNKIQSRISTAWAAFIQLLK